jgi:hypothetical protein
MVWTGVIIGSGAKVWRGQKYGADIIGLGRVQCGVRPAEGKLAGYDFKGGTNLLFDE